MMMGVLLIRLLILLHKCAKVAAVSIPEAHGRSDRGPGNRPRLSATAINRGQITSPQL